MPNRIVASLRNAQQQDHQTRGVAAALPRNLAGGAVGCAALKMGHPLIPFLIRSTSNARRKARKFC